MLRSSRAAGLETLKVLVVTAFLTAVYAFSPAQPPAQTADARAHAATGSN